MKYQKAHQRGVALIETALTLILFLVVVFGLIEFSRAMFAWNTAAEATRLGARLASICEYSSSEQQKIRDHVKMFVEASGQVQVPSSGDWLVFSYFPVGCNSNSCTSIEVSLSNLNLELILPITALSLPLPSYRTRVVRESMGNSIVIPQTSTTINNPICG